MTSFSTRTFTSADGTDLTYRQIGTGPGLIVVHGAMEYADSHAELAALLADYFTVHLLNRRGRGGSGPFGPDYSVAREVADLDAMLAATEAEFVMGVSSGAIITLTAAQTLPAIRKAVIFEPPLVIDASLSLDFLPQFETELASGDTASAMVSGMLGAQMGPKIFNYVPRSALRWMTAKMIASEAKKAQPGDVTMAELAPNLHYDFELVAGWDGNLAAFTKTDAEILLLGGAKSPAYLRTAMDALADTFPDARRITMKKTGHGATGNRNRRGKPSVAAAYIRSFLIPAVPTATTS